MFMENNDFEGKMSSANDRTRSLSINDPDDLLSPRPNSASSLGSAGNLSTFENRKQVLMQQRQRMRDRQQKRRFTGASRPISATRHGPMSNFSAPKAIDPLEGEEVLPASSIRQTGYADTYKGGFDPNMNNAIPNSRTTRSESIETKSSDSNLEEQMDAFTNRQKEEVSRDRPYGGPTEHAYREEEDISNSVPKRPNKKSDQSYDDYNNETQMNYNNSREQPREYPPKEYGERNRQHHNKPHGRRQSTERHQSRRPSTEHDSHDTFEDVDACDNRRKDSEHANVPYRDRSYRDPQANPRNVANPYNKSHKYDFGQQQQEPQQPRQRQQRLKAESKPEPRGSHKSKGAKSSAPPVVESKISHKQQVEEESKRLDEETLRDDLPSYDPTDMQEDEDDLADELELDQDEETIATEALDLSDMKRFLMEPTPKAAGVVQCYIERNKNGSKKMFPEYHLFMKDGDRFLMASKKRAKNRTSNYIISMNQHDLSRDSPSFVGKLRSNFLGTEFTIYDKGMNPKQSDPDSLTTSPGLVRQELGVVTYASNVLGSRGPRKMKVAVPEVSKEGVRKSWRPVKQSDQMLTRFKDKDLTGLTKLSNKPPRWNESVGAYVLNFNGRVTMASVKNFQLVTQEDQEAIVLQFGRVGKDLFTMDYQFPLSPFQAFAICLSSFDSKLACE